MVAMPLPTVPRRAALALAAPWAGWAVLRAAGVERGHPLVPATAFTRYAAGTSVLPVAVALLARSRRATWLAGGAAAVLGGSVLGGSVLGGSLLGGSLLGGSLLGGSVLGGSVLGTARRTPGTATSGTPLRVASLNMLYGRADPAAVLALAADVDVLALSEVTPEADEALRSVGLGELLPHGHHLAAADPARPGAGGAVWTRLPVLARAQLAGHFEQPTVRLAPPGAPPLEVTAVHTHAPTRSPDDVRAWHRDLDRLPHPQDGVLRVLAGDFNATPDHAAFRRLLRRGWVDAARATGQALRPTWTPLRCPFPRLSLDHVLVDPRIGVAALQIVHMPGTDHRALIADLRLPPG
ncbi:MAG: Metal-dependent hydrolase [Modestobacter sp.]|nr:Metal-dependent hydrolase [Modestobacter sp.]